ncbi:phosphoribosylanthranilate isomerase [Candidatus Poribacteria bacterium]|nr:phosphoribosylanthranilate isomerase [Candidatus Poribacteria bacterium]
MTGFRWLAAPRKHTGPMVFPAAFPPPQSIPFIKVCGLTRQQDALLALEEGAAFLGFIFARESPRCLDPTRAKTLLDTVRSSCGHCPVRAVGVFAAEPPSLISQLTADLELAAVQIHTEVSEELASGFPVPIIRAIRVKGPESAPAIRAAHALGPVLLDAFVEGRHGGTGKVFDHSLAMPHLRDGPVLIAGGLNPGNISGVAAGFRQSGSSMPYAFDVSSGLEDSPGIKSAARIREFFAALRSVFEP